MSAFDQLRQIAKAATPGPWEPGDVWVWAGVINTDGSCFWCAHHGDPVWVGTSDINGELMLAHKHRLKDPWEPEHRISSPNGLVTGNYDYEEGGIIAAVDTEFIATFDPTTVLALLDVAEAAGAFERISVEEWEYGVATKADADWWDDWDERRESQLEALSIALDRLREVSS